MVDQAQGSAFVQKDEAEEKTESFEERVQRASSLLEKMEPIPADQLTKARCVFAQRLADKDGASAESSFWKEAGKRWFVAAVEWSRGRGREETHGAGCPREGLRTLDGPAAKQRSLLQKGQACEGQSLLQITQKDNCPVLTGKVSLFHLVRGFGPGGYGIQNSVNFFS